MSELTREAAKARELAVRRIVDLVKWGDDPEVDGQDPAVDRASKKRAAILRRALYQMGTNAYWFRERGFERPSESDYREGIALLEALLAGTWEATPESLCLRALALDAIADGRKHLGDVPGAITALREADALAAEAGPGLEVERCETLTSLARLVAENGTREEAIATVREVAEHALGMRRDNLLVACYTLRGLAELLSKNGALEESLELALKAVEIAERVDATAPPDSHEMLPDTLLELADVHQLRGELAAAEAAIRRAKAIWEARPPTWMRDEVGTCLDKLACLREEQGDTAGCLALRREAVAFWRHEEGTNHSPNWHHIGELAQALGNLATALAAGRQWREACTLLEEALALYATELKDSHNPEAPGFTATLEECRRARREELNGKEDSMDTSPEREALLDEIIERELAMFLATPNEGGVASCQQRPETFRVMRRMAHIIHEDETLRSYLEDLRAAEESGRNFMIEKYARMDERIPPLSESHLLDEIALSEDKFMEEAAEERPDRIRRHTTHGFYRYLRSELETLSQRTLELYAREVRVAKAQGRNLALERHQWLADYLANHPRN